MTFKEDTIFDIGMHNGQDTIYYLKMGYKVVAVEANPMLVEECTKKFQNYIADGRLQIVNVGIAEEKGVLPFYVNNRMSTWSSFDKQYASKEGSTYTTIEVECVTQKDIFEEYGVPYYLKVDIEGFDYLVLKDIPEGDIKPKYVSFEATEASWIDIVRDKGYTKFKLINQLSYKDVNLKKEKSRSWLFTLQVKQSIQKYFPFVPFKHKKGATGPFGEHLEGKWLSYDEIMYIYNEFHDKKYNRFSWFDVHATY